MGQERERGATLSHTARDKEISFLSSRKGNNDKKINI